MNGFPSLEGWDDDWITEYTFSMPFGWEAFFPMHTNSRGIPQPEMSSMPFGGEGFPSRDYDWDVRRHDLRVTNAFRQGGAPLLY